MNLDKYLSTQETLVEFSKRTGIPTSSLSFWRHGKRPIPLGWMAIIEKETSGLVTRQELCPDKWKIHWPELAQQDQTNTDELIPGEAVDWGDREVPHLPPLEPDDDRIEIGCSSAK